MLDVLEANRPLIRRVAVVDDDELGREMLMDDLRDRQFDPVAVDGTYGQDIDRMLDDLAAKQPQFVICDHRLQPKGLASFFGLDLVQRLLNLQRPAMLLTQYQTTESTRLQLRSARHSVPLIMARDSFQLDELPAYADLVQRELEGSPVDARRPHRSIIQIDNVDHATGNVDAVVPGWSPTHALTIPADCFAASIRRRLSPGDLVLGDVNIGAKTEEELYFKNLDEIVTPDPSDGLQ
jgi:CheY-like chemotaxis protein